MNEEILKAKEKRIEDKMRDLVVAYRRFTENTGRTSVFDMLSMSFKDKEKVGLIVALGELEEAYCEKNGWASTNPMVLRDVEEGGKS